jgi:predicted nucleotidyltransferase
MSEAVTAQIALPTDQIRAFCRKWNIRELALFGSVLREDFGAHSDIDVLVDFEPETHHTLFDLVRMADELETLFGRKVDLLTWQGVVESPNYIRRREILGTARVIYAE